MVPRGLGFAVVIELLGGGCRIGFDEIDRVASCSWDPAPVFAGDPERIEAIATPGVNIGDPTLSADGLTLFYQRSGTVLSARRASRDAPFGPGEEVAELAGMAGKATGFSLAADGLTAFVSLDDGIDVDPYQMTRASIDQPLGPPVEITELASPGFEFNVRASGDGLTALFVRWGTNDEPTTADSFVAFRSSRDAPWTDVAPTPWSTPGVVDAVAHPVPGGFVFDVAGSMAVVHGDFATGFDTPVPVGIDSGGYDGLPFVTADGCEVVFVSDRDGAFHIFRVEVTPVD